MHEREKKKLEYTPDKLVAMAGSHRCNHMDFKKERREERRKGRRGERTQASEVIENWSAVVLEEVALAVNESPVWLVVVCVGVC